MRGGEEYELEARSLALLRLRQEAGTASSNREKFLLYEGNSSGDEQYRNRTALRSRMFPLYSSHSNKTKPIKTVQSSTEVIEGAADLGEGGVAGQLNRGTATKSLEV